MLLLSLFPLKSRDRCPQPIFDGRFEFLLVLAPRDDVNGFFCLIQRNVMTGHVFNTSLGRNELHQEAVLAWMGPVGIAEIEAGQRVLKPLFDGLSGILESSSLPSSVALFQGRRCLGGPPTELPPSSDRSSQVLNLHLALTIITCRAPSTTPLPCFRLHGASLLLRQLFLQPLNGGVQPAEQGDLSFLSFSCFLQRMDGVTALVQGNKVARILFIPVFRRDKVRQNTLIAGSSLPGFSSVETGDRIPQKPFFFPRCTNGAPVTPVFENVSLEFQDFDRVIQFVCQG